MYTVFYQTEDCCDTLGYFESYDLAMIFLVSYAHLHLVSIDDLVIARATVSEFLKDIKERFQR